MGILDKYYRDGGLMTADDFRDQSVPGATAGVDPVTLQPYVDQQNVAAMERVAQGVSDDTRNTQIATQELSDEQKAAEEERKKQIELEKSKLKEQQAILDRADKEAGLGMRPEPEEELPPFDPTDVPDEVFTEEDVAADDAVIAREQQAAQPQGAALVSQGYGRQKEGVAGAGGAKAAEIMADAEIDQAMGKAREADLAADDALQLKRLEIENVRKEIDSQILAEMERDIKPPSPSALGLIGVFLNGLIAPMQGGRNTALDIVQKQMQREVNIEMDNRRKRISLLNRRRGIVADEEMGIQKQQAASDLKLAKKYKAFRMQLESALKTPTLTAQQRANTQALIGQIEVEEGKYQLKAAQDIFAAQLKMRAQIAKENTKKRGPSISSTRKPKQPEGVQYGVTYWNRNTGTGVSGADIDKEQKDRERSFSEGITLSVPGRGDFGGVTVNSKDEAKLLAEGVRAYHDIRQPTQRMLALMSEKKGSLEDVMIGPFAKSVAAQMAASEYTQLMMGIKDLWKMGAIQAPDAKYLKAAIGMEPNEFMRFIGENMSAADMRQTLQNFQSGAETKIKNQILTAAGLQGTGATVDLGAPPVTEDIDAWRMKQKAETPDQLLGKIGKMVERQEAISSGAPGTEDLEQVSKDVITQAVGNFANMVKAGKFTSAGKESGGEVAQGHHIAQYTKLRNMAPEGELRDAMDDGLDEILNTYPTREDLADQRTAKILALGTNAHAMNTVAGRAMLETKKIKPKYEGHLKKLRRARRNKELKRRKQSYRFDLNPQ